jgi:hypothetical protein
LIKGKKRGHYFLNENPATHSLEFKFMSNSLKVKFIKAQYKLTGDALELLGHQGSDSVRWMFKRRKIIKAKPLL